MALTMARPWRNKHGVYSLRQRTPADLIQRLRGQKVTLPVGEAFAEATIGEMVQVSLRTHDPAQARSLHSAADAALRRYWDTARRRPLSLSHKL